MKKLSRIFSQWLLTIFLLAGLQFTAASQTATHLHFDGVNDYVNLPVSSLFDFSTGDFTAEAWIKTSNTNTQVIAGCFNSNSNNFWLGTTVSGTGKAAFSISGTTVQGTSTVNNNQWHHIAGVRLSGIIYIYVDGIMEASFANTSSFTTLGNSLKLGNFNNAFYFAGEADEVRIWNAAQTAGNIAARRNIELAGNETGLLAYYKFNQGIAGGNNTAITTLTNSTANALNGTITNFTLSSATSNFLSGSPVPQPQGTHLNFDGVNDIVNCGTAFNTIFSNLNTVTVEAWVKPETNTGLGVIAGNYSYPTNNAFMQFLLRRDGTNYIFWMRNSTNTNFVNVVATNAVVVNTWQHVVGVRNGDALMIYVNGVLVNTATGMGTQNFPANTGNELTIGGDGVVPTPEFFKGSIDEVRVWTTAVASTDIVRRKNCELQGNEPSLYAYYKFNQGVAGGTNTTVTSLTNSSVIAGLNGTLTNMALTGATSNWLAGSPVTTGSTIPAAATAFAQSFCGSGTVANLVPAPSATINWYNVPTGGAALAGTTALATGTYYVSAVNANGCESNRTSVSITFNAIPPPPVASAQNFCGSGTIANLSPAPSATYNWYNVATGGTALPGTTALATGIYYVSASSAPGCESARTSVNVTISNSLIYVKADATGTNDGSSWTNAYTSLQSALQNTCAQSIWVAAGTYRPSTDNNGNIPTDLRNKQFYIKPALKIYGGFAGNEASLSQRNIAANPTILDGDIGVAGDNTDNCYHVVVAVNSYTGFPGVTIDGFHVRNGNANGTGYISYSGEFAFGNQGGGIFVSKLQQNKIVNNNIYNNTSSADGAGLYILTNIGTDTISGNTFYNNSNAASGGGMYLALASTGFINGNVINNNSAADGGGIYSTFSNTTQKIVNNIIYNNTATNGAGVYFSNNRGTFAHNTLFNNNASVAGGGAYLFADVAGFGSTLNNNIFWLNKQNNSSAAQGADFAKGTGGQFYVLKNNSLQLSSGNYTSIGSGSYDLGATALGNLFAQNPLFLNEASPAGSDAVYGTADDGLQVLCTSPMLNAGLAGTGITNDIIAGVRNVTTPTIGAYEAANISTGILASSYQSVTTIQTSTIFYGSCSNLIAALQSNGVLAVNGSTTAKVWVEGTQNPLFVKRHYEITPALNTATATGRVTLYFTQAEFDDFNAVSVVDLPTGPADVAGKTNLLIEKRSGVSSDGSGLPATYIGSVITIDPVDADIVWKVTANRWEVSFDVTGFSGFFIKTQSGLLPISLINFTAAKQTNEVLLQWQTNTEINFSHFEVERSTNGYSFELVDKVFAHNTTGNNNYQLTDIEAWASDVRYYRLKLIDNDGKFKYSTIIRLSNKQQSGVSIYPNPVKDIFTLQVTDNKLLRTTATLIDVSGKLIKSITINNLFQTVDITLLTKGMYLVKFEDGSVVKIIKE
jgi:hypothetical protein